MDGRIPNKVHEIWVSPTNMAGPFAFQIDSIERASPPTVLRKALAAPKRMFFAASARLVRLNEESRPQSSLGARPRKF